MKAKKQQQDGKVKWKNSRCIFSHKELLGIDGEAIEFEWNIFLGCSSLQILQQIQNNSHKRNIKPDEVTDQIIFMSMSSDIDWTKEGNDGICIFECRISQGIREKILARTLDFSGSWKWKEVV